MLAASWELNSGSQPGSHFFSVRSLGEVNWDPYSVMAGTKKDCAERGLQEGKPNKPVLIEAWASWLLMSR